MVRLITVSKWRQLTCPSERLFRSSNLWVTFTYHYNNLLIHSVDLCVCLCSCSKERIPTHTMRTGLLYLIAVDIFFK